ncbi:MAG: PD-(D/E)XK nuclease family protein [Parabacteroides sp.]
MKPFLQQVAEAFFAHYGKEVSHLAFVFPNRRAGLFFQKYLSEEAVQPLFSPKILTINDLFVQLSGKVLADKMSMLFKLYEIYLQRSGSEETFDQFVYWGEMLLGDFDDIDKYMVDAGKLFTNVTDLRMLDDGYSFLSDEQIAAIRTFWSSFYPQGKVKHQNNFLSIWEILYSIYEDLRRSLAAEGKGYEGMIFREVVEELRNGKSLKFPYEKVVFVGLNALSVAEEQFLLELKHVGIADFYWDYDSPMVNDPANKASFFVTHNRQQFPSAFHLEAESTQQNKIEVIGIPSGVGQAKSLHTLLDELLQQENTLNDEKALRTAVVLPDERLLVPVLDSIPESIRHINVTMGYPLAGTQVSSLIEYVLILQKNCSSRNRQSVFYFRDVLPILNHRYIRIADGTGVISTLVADIARKNRVYIAANELAKNELLSAIFVQVDDVHSLSDYLLNILQLLNKSFYTTADLEDNGDENHSTLRDVEQEFVFHYFATVNRLKTLISEANISMRIDTYMRLLKRFVDTVTIAFEGEPLSGLQVMGVLETRALDFDRLIILSMNEGVFPMKKTTGSFIPYNLRRGFGLPTYEHQDSVWAYHFYRLLYRASDVYLLYDTRSNEKQTGEVSRFVHQLQYHYEVPLIKKLLVYNVSASTARTLSMPKNESVMRQLEAYMKGGSRALSASAINTYLDCPLQFYFSEVEQIRDEDEVTETIESDVFGDILHRVMQLLYSPLCGKQVTADLLTAVSKDLETMKGAIEQAFAEKYFKTEQKQPLTGQVFLYAEIIRKYVEQILICDKRLTPFCYIASEYRMKTCFELSDRRKIQLKGFIDRIDEVQGVIRIIDYKTGNPIVSFAETTDLFDKTMSNRPKYVMQVFFYSWMYHANAGKKAIRPGIYVVRSMFANDFSADIRHRLDARRSEMVDDYNDRHDEFEASLRTCLDEIFNVSVPFTQTTTGKACGYCSFKAICGK